VGRFFFLLGEDGISLRRRCLRNLVLVDNGGGESDESELSFSDGVGERQHFLLFPVWVGIGKEEVLMSVVGNS
jgi:hypothetical protein